VTFEEFAKQAAPKLRSALVGACGADVGLDAAAEAMAFGWENWPTVSAMENPTGYLYRVGQTAARRLRRDPPLFPAPEPTRVDSFTPELLPALTELSDMQRICVVMVHGHGWPATETADLLDISVSSVRTHIDRALNALREALEIDHDRV